MDIPTAIDDKLSAFKKPSISSSVTNEFRGLRYTSVLQPDEQSSIYQTSLEYKWQTNLTRTQDFFTFGNYGHVDTPQVLYLSQDGSIHRQFAFPSLYPLHRTFSPASISVERPNFPEFSLTRPNQVNATSNKSSLDTFNTSTSQNEGLGGLEGLDFEVLSPNAQLGNKEKTKEQKHAASILRSNNDAKFNSESDTLFFTEEEIDSDGSTQELAEFLEARLLDKGDIETSDTKDLYCYETDGCLETESDGNDNQHCFSSKSKIAVQKLTKTQKKKSPPKRLKRHFQKRTEKLNSAKSTDVYVLQRRRDDANKRERVRIRKMKKAFRVLKHKLPDLGPKTFMKRPSRMSILKAAIDYIKLLQDLLKCCETITTLQEEDHEKSLPQTVESKGTHKNYLL